MSGPPGYIRYECPFDCGWHYDQTETTRLTIGPGETIDPGESLSDAITTAVTAARRRQAAETEAAIREHLTEHTARVMLGEGP